MNYKEEAIKSGKPRKYRNPFGDYEVPPMKVQFRRVINRTDTYDRILAEESVPFTRDTSSWWACIDELAEITEKQGEIREIPEVCKNARITYTLYDNPWGYYKGKKKDIVVVEVKGGKIRYLPAREFRKIVKNTIKEFGIEEHVRRAKKLRRQGVTYLWGEMPPTG